MTYFVGRETPICQIHYVVCQVVGGGPYPFRCPVGGEQYDENGNSPLNAPVPPYTVAPPRPSQADDGMYWNTNNDVNFGPFTPPRVVGVNVGKGPGG